MHIISTKLLLFFFFALLLLLFCSYLQLSLIFARCCNSIYFQFARMQHAGNRARWSKRGRRRRAAHFSLDTQLYQRNLHVERNLTNVVAVHSFCCCFCSFFFFYFLLLLLYRCRVHVVSHWLHLLVVSTPTQTNTRTHSH